MTGHVAHPTRRGRELAKSTAKPQPKHRLVPIPPRLLLTLQPILHLPPFGLFPLDQSLDTRLLLITRLAAYGRFSSIDKGTMEEVEC